MDGDAETEGCALPLARFLFGSLGAFLFQVPALFIGASFEWSFFAALMTGAFCARKARRIGTAPAGYLILATVIALFYVLDPPSRPEAVLPGLGGMLGSWALMAGAFIVVSLRRRRAAAFDAFLAARREMKNPPAA